MAVRVYKPTTPARRRTSVIDTRHLSAPRKELLTSVTYKAGRSNGAISVRHRGGAGRRRARIVDFVQSKEVPAKIEALTYDPYRSAFLAQLLYVDGDRRYVLAEATQKVGDAIQVGEKAPVRRGNRLPLRRLPSGTDIYNVQISREGKGTLVRAAGTSGSVVAHEESGYTQIKLPSGEVRRVLSDCLATVGVVSNREHENVRIGKAGRNRHKGIRPHVRGKAMNPVDHPHGGGEGGSPIGLKGPKTPSGLYTLGRKTRRQKKSMKQIVRRRGSR
jgi:large subunit ribosomal protein L2